MKGSIITVTLTDNGPSKGCNGDDDAKVILCGKMHSLKGLSEGMKIIIEIPLAFKPFECILLFGAGIIQHRSAHPSRMDAPDCWIDASREDSSVHLA